MFQSLLRENKDLLLPAVMIALLALSIMGSLATGNFGVWVR